MKYRYRTDEEMKDSGVEWCNRIPKNWIKSKLKRELIFKVGGTPSTSNKEYFDGNNTWINISDLKGKFCCESKNKISDKAVKDYNISLVPKGSLLYSFKLSVGQVAFTTKDLYTNEAIAAFAPSNRYNVNYWYYALGNYLIENANENIYGAKILNQDLIKNATIFLPSKYEQEKVANFLDEKTSQFDLIILKKEALIEKLEEAKKSLISEVVTGKVMVIKTKNGYDVVPRSREEMKDSGVEWVKNIPKHWKVVNGKRLFSQRKDKAFENDEQLTASQKYGIIFQKEFMELENQKVVLVDKNFSILKHVEPNDFVISMRSFQGGLEYSTIRGCISSAYVMLIPNDMVYAPFFRWFFKSEQYINALQSTSNLVRDGQAMRFSNFIQIPIFEFSKEEQQEIAEYLDFSVNNMNKLIDKIKCQVEKLKEAKQSLITEAVTGKIEILD
ncbi:restriction endonuclease subunit S [Clostridium butyricum]|uniref:restriction endonuclease subunit S n=1 Tax=Clostridium butyricum TaxID=1492 RepID=UPI00374E2889